MTSDIHEANNTLIARLRAEGSPLSIEAADKIEALRRRGKFWHRTALDERALRLDAARKIAQFAANNRRYNEYIKAAEADIAMYKKALKRCEGWRDRYLSTPADKHEITELQNDHSS
jgi:hypothetical protein